jgi:hypothetical protein
MDADLNGLEQKITQLLGLYNALREENALLKSDLNARLVENAQIKATMLEASSRVEALMDQLP